MMLRRLAALLLLAGAPLCAMPVAAAEPAVAEADPHEALYSTLERGVDRNAMFDGMLASARAQYAANPMFAEIERAHPGFIDEVIVAMRPTLEVYSERVRLEYRPRMIASLRAEISGAEALELTRFYDSPLGRKIIQVSSRNYRPDNVLANIGSDNGTTAQEVAADMRAVNAATARELTDEEKAILVREVTANPAFAKLERAMSKLTELRARMEEERTVPAEDAQLEAAMKRIFARYR